MIRTFSQHKIRKQKELTGVGWVFYPLDGSGRSFTVKTPSCWETYPGYYNYRGEGKYETEFEAGGNIRIEFKGVSHTAKVYLDGEFLAEHYNAYTIFDCIKSNVAHGIHKLEVFADNSFSEKSALHVPNDYMSYGGINRPVVLETINDIYVKQIHIRTSKKDSWTAYAEFTLENISDVNKIVDLDVDIAGCGRYIKDIQIGPGEDRICSAEISFDDVLEWNIGEGNLYDVSATVIENGIPKDDLCDRFGFREIKTESKKLYVNGREVKIKGFNRHEDHPDFASAVPFDVIANDLAIMKDLGANSLRTSHYPNDEIMLDLCDEEGILVWEENHARGLSLEQMMNPNFEPQAEKVIEEMIWSHFNHPSICIWGILNECSSDTDEGKEMYRKQFELISKLDNTRPKSFASFKFFKDKCFDLVDIVSYNIYPLWYHNTEPGKYLDDLYNWVQSETEGKGKPFLITEVGAGGIYGCHNKANTKWTEEYQAYALDNQLGAILKYDNCIGVFIWQFCDIRVSDEWFSYRPRTMNNKGVVDEFRRKKMCYDIVKKHFTE